MSDFRLPSAIRREQLREPLMLSVRYEPGNWEYELWLLTHNGNYIAQDVTFRPHEMGHTEYQPPIAFCQSEAQKLMDELWNCGIRPTSGAGSAGQLAATESHLDDMRALVQGFTKHKLPERRQP
jgi:hypothetical protein